MESDRVAGCVGSNSGIIYDERVDVVVGDDVRYNLLVLFVAGHWANSFRF